MHNDAVVSRLQVLDDEFARTIGLRCPIDVFVDRMHGDESSRNGSSCRILHRTADAAESGLRMGITGEHDRAREC